MAEQFDRKPLDPKKSTQKIECLELKIENGYTVAEIEADNKSGFDVNNIIKMFYVCKDYDGEVFYKLADDLEGKNIYDAKSIMATMLIGAELYEGKKVAFFVEGTDKKAACLARRLNSSALSSDASDKTSE